MKPVTKIKIIGWSLLGVGAINILLPPYQLKSILAGILWVIGGIGIILKNNIARIIIMSLALITVWMTIIGVVASLVATVLPRIISTGNSGSSKYFDSNTIIYFVLMGVIILLSASLSFYVYKLLRKDEIKAEFVKKLG